MRTIALTAALAVAACAAPAPPPPPAPFWHRSGTTETWPRDRYECARDAMMVPPRQQIISSGGYRIGNVWIPPRVDSYDDSGADRIQILTLCLEARGWRQSPTDPWPRQRAAAPPPLQTAEERALQRQIDALPQDPVAREQPIVFPPDDQRRLEQAFQEMMRDPEAAAWLNRPASR